MKTVLVLDGHSHAALACTQALGRAGLSVHVASESGCALSWRSRFARRRVPQPPAGAIDFFVEWLRARDAAESYTLIVASTESSLLALRALPEDDPLRRRAVLPANRALDAALDKHATLQLAESLGIPVPHTTHIASEGDIAPVREFPVVLKPVRSKVMMGGQLVTPGATVARHENARRTTLEGWLPWTAVEQQSYAPGRGCGLGLLYERGRRMWHFAWKRVHEMPLTGGASTYRCSITPSAEILDATTRLLDTLSWHGAVMVEFRVTDDGRFSLMEINPRLWGSLALAGATGVDFPRGLLRLAEGEPPGPQPAYRSGQYARSLPGDAEWFAQNLRADRTDPLLLTSPPGRALAEFARLALGRESWDFFTPRDPRVALAIVGRTFATMRRVFSKRSRRRRLRWSLAWRHRVSNGGLRASAAKPVHLLFLCHGNICRSPVAAALARKLLPGETVESAGYHRMEGRKSPSHVCEAAREQGLDLDGHRSKRVTARQVEKASLILLMDVENYEALVEEFPEAADKATLLALFEPEGPSDSIADPLDATPEETRRVVGQIARSVAGLQRALVSARAAGLAASPASIGAPRP